MKKSNQPKTKKRKAKGSTTTRSTAGPGFNFEDQVAAWLLTKMLCGEPIPGIDAPGAQLQTQTGALEWNIDDLLVTGMMDSGETQHLAVSCKSNVQVTSSGLPSDFVAAAWQQWRKAGPMCRGSDCLALATRGRNSPFEATWSDIKNWCDDGDAALAIARINETAKHRKVFESVKAPGKEVGASVSDEDVVVLIQHLRVLPLDFQLAHSEAEKHAITRCRGILRSGSLEDARKLWGALVQRAEKARLGNGTIRLLDLWRELRKDFELRDHPDFGSSWDALASITRDYKSTIENALPSGFTVARTNDIDKLNRLVGAEAVSIVYGDSGSGKSALVKSTLDSKFPDWTQVWLGPEELENALGEANRAKLRLIHPLLDVLNGAAHPKNVLVIDAAERLTADCVIKAKKLIAELISNNSADEPDAWRIVIIGQTEAWADSRLQALAGASLPKSLELGGASPEDVKAALGSSKSLRWLAFYDDTVAALTNLRTLAWVMKADTVFQGQRGSGAMSLPAIVDHLWAHWTLGRATLQSLLMRLAEREASFERSFAVSEMEPADAAAYEAGPPQLPLRQNDRNRVEFQHDLAADWARYQRLKEIAHDTTRWALLAKNPLWIGALRMLGQYLLREPVNSRTAWDVAIESVEKDKDTAPLAVDVLLDALCLDPLAEMLLTERADLLFENHGALLNRLLRRFQHIATVPGVPAALLAVDPSLRLYLEAHYRTPILGRWPAIARFLASHHERVAELISPVVAKVCETWLTTTPADLRPGVAMPFRKEFAEIALASARMLQIAQGKRVIFMDDSEKPIYTAALAAAPDLPDEVAEWALEMAQRRPYRKDVTEKIAAFRHQEVEERAERIRTDAAYREREQQRQASIPTFIPSSRKLPPWPLGAKDRIEQAFCECCIHSQALAQLMKVRPQIVAEILLAAIIEDSPEESYSDSPLMDWDIGLEFDSESYPTAYWKSPFFQFLQINSEAALAALLQLVDFCTERWAHERSKTGASHPAEITITLNDGTEPVFTGNHMVFDWAQTNSNSTGQLYSTLAALERWLCMGLDNGANIAPFVERILRGSKSVGVLGVLANVGKYRPELFSGPLRPLLGSLELYIWDDYRVNEALRYHFDAFSWSRAGETVFEMARQWTLAPFRKVTLRKIAASLINTDTSVADFLKEAVQKWKTPSGDKEDLEFRMLGAELDRRNYRTTRDEKSGQVTIELQYPAELRRDIAEYEHATLATIQTLRLPSQCERILLSPEMLTAQQSEALASALNSAPSDEDLDEGTKRRTRIAVASTLAAKATDWLTLHPDVHQKVDEIIRDIVASIGESPESFRHSFSLGGGGELQFAAHAVMHQWMAAPGDAKEWEPSVLRILTSKDGPAISTLISIAHANRSRLGSKWWRFLQLALLSSGLSILAPGFDDPKSLETHWVRWLRWLRARSLDYGNTGAEAIDPLAIARRVERLQRARWRRAHAREEGRFHRSPEERHSSGLDTHLLGHIFSWLLRDSSDRTPVLDAADREQDRKLAQALWAFEAWRRHQDIDHDGEHGTPSQLGYDVLSVLARMVLSASLKEAVGLWQPVFSLGADAHYSIGHFISCWFGQISSGCDSATFAQHWQAMLKYALEAPNWTSGRRWYYGEQLLRQLLGCGSDQAISRVPDYQTLILQMRDLYEEWARGHLHKDEDNVAGFCGFLASDAGAPLRLDGLQWLAAALYDETRAIHWYRERTGNALTELLDVILSEDAEKASASPQAREALVSLAAELAARQVHAALALQERIKKIR